LRARRAELASAIATLSRSASALRVRRGGIAPASVGDSEAGTAVADAAAAPGNGGGGGSTLASVKRSLAQVRRLLSLFDQRWGFVRGHTLSAALEVCVCVCVCVCVLPLLGVAISLFGVVVSTSS
jgi:hypothetical protein